MPLTDRRLPWQRLASTFEPAFARVSSATISPTPCKIVRKGGEDATKEASIFVQCVMEAILEDVTKLQSEIAPAASSGCADILIDDASTKRITRTIKRLRLLHRTPRGTCPYTKRYCKDPGNLCTHSKRARCDCVVPLWTRQTASLGKVYEAPMLKRYHSLSCDDDRTIAFDYCSALLLHEDLAPLLRIHKLLLEQPPTESWLASGRRHLQWTCDMALKRLLQPYGQIPRMPETDTQVSRINRRRSLQTMYERTFRRTLLSYLTLNLLLAMPETWDPEEKCEAWHDYRDIDLYQVMVLTACKGGMIGANNGVEMSSFPHGSFFDVPDRWWFLMPWIQTPESNEPRSVFHAKWSADTHEQSLVDPGALPFESFVGGSGKVRRGEHDSSPERNEARVALASKGLPCELVDIVMDLVEEEQPWRLAIKDDPLHPANRRMLKNYLEYCWRLMACCWVALQDIDDDNQGTVTGGMEDIVSEAVQLLGGVSGPCLSRTCWCQWCRLRK